MNVLLTIIFTINGCFMITSNAKSSTPCSVQDEIPKAVGEPLFMGEDSSPYNFFILNADGRTIKYFDEQVYEIHLNGTSFFRRFLIQSRVASEHGLILDSPGGEFLPDEEWKRQGIRMLDCPSVINDAITQEIDRKKFSLEVQWIPKRFDAPIQILVSIQQDPKLEWIHLAPKSGFIFPFVAEISTSKSENIDENDDNFSSFTTNYETTNYFQDVNSKLIAPHAYFLLDKKLDKEDKLRLKSAKNVDIGMDYCAGNPCLDHGLCVNVAHEHTFECYCTDEWSGEDCMTPNHCFNHPCRNLGTCVNDDYGFTCQCLPGWGGQLCEKLNFCSSNPCLNGGSCRDDLDGFECECPKQYMGDRCQRACQDILLGCEHYDEHEYCDSSNENVSIFYHTNCASTCGKCIYDVSKIKSATPLPVALDPLQMLLGSWRMDVKSSTARYPVDFPDAHDGYVEQLEFFRPFVFSPFDPPAISFRTIAYNKDDKNDIALNSGFIFLNSNKVSMTTVGNDGLFLIEDGKMTGKDKFRLASSYFYVHSSIAKKVPIKIKRSFFWTENRLEINIERFSINGRFDNETLRFAREKNPISF